MTPWPELLRVFGRIGLLSFGGPAAQIALMHRELVDRRGWLDEAQFLRALSFCMLLPGPEAMQLATYAGWRLRGIPGGLLAGGLFVLPGALVMLALVSAYAAWGQTPALAALFLGVKSCVVVIVIEALLRVSRRALKRPAAWVTAGLAFLAIFALHLPFPLIILAAGLYGALSLGAAPAVPLPASPLPAAPPGAAAPPGNRPASFGATLGTILTWLAIWGLPVALVWGLGNELLTAVALFFSKLAVVTFGGAYAVLAYMAQEAVETRGWLSTPAMMDGLGLAETTPGPLILVTVFVGFLAGHGAGGWGLALAAAGLTLWVTFAPCFLWIFAGAPWLERITARPRLNAALQAITAAVVGVILNLSLWFALHVLFARVGEWRLGPAVLPVTLPLPDWASLDPLALALTLLAALLLLALHRSLFLTLGLCATLGWGVSMLTG